MMNVIWGAIIAVSIVYSFFAHTTEQVSDAVFKGAQSAVELSISMAGMLCFWSGMMEIAEKSGVTKLISKFFSPVLGRIMPDIDKNSKAFHCISMNISANLLGLGNAATPFGINAMKEMKRLNSDSSYISDSMLVFVVMNTASLQILPTTLLTLRSACNSAAPYEILPCIWLSSSLALVFGVTLALILNKRKSHRLP